MDLTDHFIKLSCSNCGDELEVYDDMERFFCGHCGAGIEIQRRGGTVVLRIATEAPKAAAEPAGRPLTDEAGILSKRREDMLTARTERNKWGYIGAISLLAIGFMLVRSGFSFVLGLGMLLAGIITISYVRRTDKKVLADVRDLQTKIDMLSGRH